MNHVYSSSSCQRVLDLSSESVIKPDAELRANMASKNCCVEPMEVRRHCLTCLNALKEIHQIESNGEIDEIEVGKIVNAEINFLEMVFSYSEMM